jgi:hypothetical protein
MSQNHDSGNPLANRLLGAVAQLRRHQLDGNRQTIMGVTSDARFLGEMTAEQFVRESVAILKATNRFYRWGERILADRTTTVVSRLVPLRTGHQIETSAKHELRRHIQIGSESDRGITIALVPGNLIDLVLTDPLIDDGLPEIVHYARRPVYDDAFTLRQPGYHPDAKILVHGPTIEPAEWTSGLSDVQSHDALQGNLQKLPPRLRVLLSDFCFASGADLANAVAIMLTGVLMNHFLDIPHPLTLLLGNQAGVGKTLLAQLIGLLLDGEMPPLLTFSSNEEFEKRIGAEMRGEHSVLTLDNVRGKCNSPFLEANCMAAKISTRRLGSNDTIVRQNSFLWIMTSNGLQTTTDLIRRAVPIRLHHDGNPAERHFNMQEPSRFVAEHRQEILAELFAMVEAWKDHGLRQANAQHRCLEWARLLGGVLEANGLVGFLANLQETEAETDETLIDLASIAEYVARMPNRRVFAATHETASVGKPVSDWTPVLRGAGVETERLLHLSGRSLATTVGRILAPKVNRFVHIELEGSTFEVTLRKLERRSNQKLYWLQVRPSGPNANVPASEPWMSPDVCPADEQANSPPCLEPAEQTVPGTDPWPTIPDREPIE